MALHAASSLCFSLPLIKHSVHDEGGVEGRLGSSWLWFAP